MTSSNCCFLICTQVSQEAAKVVWYFQSLEEFSTVCCDSYSPMLSVVNEAEIRLGIPLLFLYLTDVSNLISDFSDFSKSSLYYLEVLSS